MTTQKTFLSAPTPGRHIPYVKVLAKAQAEEYCDVGHYYCPTLNDAGSIVFPSGVVRKNNTFSGARRLFELLLATIDCEESSKINLFMSGSESGGIRHYPYGTNCVISTLPD